MIIAVASYKDGVDKTTAAVHLAIYLQMLALTLLLDGDDNCDATAWSQCGKCFSFKVADEVQAARYTLDFTHTVTDTGKGPKQGVLQAPSHGSDLLIIPTVPASLDRGGFVLTLQTLQDIGNERYRRQRRSRGRKLV